MKKRFGIILIIFILFSMSIISYAGDIPESLLNSHSSQVFFGEVKEVSEYQITMIQHKNIKGVFTEGSELTYTKYIFTDSPNIGELYLCGVLDNSNHLYIWEISSLDTKDLTIPNANSMSLRMQEYLNDGLFEEKEKERLASLEPSSSAPASETVSASTEPPANTVVTDSAAATVSAQPYLLPTALLLLGAVLVFFPKRKR